MKPGLFVLVLSVVCFFFVTATVAQIFSDALASQVWDEYINRYMRIAKEKGAAGATARNQQIRDLIAQQHAFPSWTELNAQAAKDIGPEKWNQITQQKMAELKSKVEALQGGAAEKAAGAAQEAAKKAPFSF